MTFLKASSLASPHLLGIESLTPSEINLLLDLSEHYVDMNRSGSKKTDLLRGRTIINVFFESSTRTRTSFELAGKRLGADVIGERHPEHQLRHAALFLRSTGTAATVRVVLWLAAAHRNL